MPQAPRKLGRVLRRRECELGGELSVRVRADLDLYAEGCTERVRELGCGRHKVRVKASVAVGSAGDAAPCRRRAGVARWVDMARISTRRSRLGQHQKPQQRDPLQYFNSLLDLLF